MVEDSYITEEYQKIEAYFSEGFKKAFIPPLDAQIFCGVKKSLDDPHPAGCDRHQLLFDKYNVIAEYCFNCYKIEIQPKTVIELFKLVFMFKLFSFPGNCTRKCFLRPDKYTASHYSGLIYLTNTNDAKSILKDIEHIVNANIGENIPVFIKRGCSNYAIKYPDYAELDKNHEPVLKSNEEWKKIEEEFNREKLADQLKALSEDPYPSEFTLIDYLSMQTWLSYAKSIGDDSYMKVTNSPVDIIPNLDPAPFTSNR